MNSSQGCCGIRGPRRRENMQPLFKRQKKTFSSSSSFPFLLSLSQTVMVFFVCYLMTGSLRQRMLVGQVGGDQQRLLGGRVEGREGGSQWLKLILGSREVAAGRPVKLPAHAPLSHHTSLTKHRYKDKVI